MSAGIRCAETTSTSCRTSNSSSAFEAPSIPGQSESDPMTTPTTGDPLVPLPAMTPPRFLPRRETSPSPAPDVRWKALCRERSRRNRRLLVDDAGDEFRGVPGAREAVLEVCPADGDVPDLAARADLLAVQVHLDPGVAGHHVQVGPVQVLVRPAEHVDHDRPRRPRPRVAQ